MSGDIKTWRALQSMDEEIQGQGCNQQVEVEEMILFPNREGPTMRTERCEPCGDRDELQMCDTGERLLCRNCVERHRDNYPSHKID
jgi:hypothetical protein